MDYEITKITTIVFGFAVVELNHIGRVMSMIIKNGYHKNQGIKILYSQNNVFHVLTLF